MSMVIIYGPMASGKTHHKQAFAKYYRKKVIVDEWCAWEHEIPSDGRLVLTTSTYREIASQFAEDGPFDFPSHIIDITIARMAIGVNPHAPLLMRRQAL